MKAATEVNTNAGKYLTFKLANENFGISLTRVQEIIGMVLAIRVPRSPEHIRGVINLRGKIVPVIDLRARLGFPTKADTDLSCIIVLQAKRGNAPWTVGVVVDEVSDVLELKSNQLEAPPDFGAAVATDAILAMGKVDSRVITLLCIEKVLESGVPAGDVVQA